MSSEASTWSGSRTMPSRIASTWPRIAVSGVRSSWDTDMRKERLSFSASASFATMRRKRSLSWEISSPPFVSGISTSYCPAATRCVARVSASTGSVSRRDSHQKRTALSAIPTASARARRPASVSHCSRSSVTGFATTSQPNGSVPRTSCTGCAAASSRRSLVGRRELERDELLAVELDVPERVPRELPEAEALPRKERRAHVVELVAGRELEVSAANSGAFEPSSLERSAASA